MNISIKKAEIMLLSNLLLSYCFNRALKVAAFQKHSQGAYTCPLPISSSIFKNYN